MMVKVSITIPEEYHARLVRLQEAKRGLEGRAVSFTEVVLETSRNGIGIAEDDLGIGLSFPYKRLSEKQFIALGVKQVCQRAIDDLIPDWVQ